MLWHRPPEAVFIEFHDLIFYTNDLALIATVSLGLLTCSRSHPKAQLWMLTAPLVGRSSQYRLYDHSAFSVLFTLFDPDRVVLQIQFYSLFSGRWYCDSGCGHPEIVFALVIPILGQLGASVVALISSVFLGLLLTPLAGRALGEVSKHS